MANAIKTKQHIIKSSSGKITWGELKQLVEKSGVREDDEIDAIEVSWGDIEDVQCEKDDDFGWQIKM